VVAYFFGPPCVCNVSYWSSMCIWQLYCSSSKEKDH